MTLEQQVAEAAARAGGEVVARYFRDFANVAVMRKPLTSELLSLLM